MGRLGDILDKLFDGNLRTCGIKVSPSDVYELYDAYVDIKEGRGWATISENVNHVLNACGIDTEPRGIGWEVIA